MRLCAQQLCNMSSPGSVSGRPIGNVGGISGNYYAVCRNLIVRFLKQYRLDEHLCKHVKPKNPYRFAKTGGEREIVTTRAKNDDDISILISEIENDGKRVPVLIRHYLNLNADFAGFNVDKAFSVVVNGPVMVDFHTKLIPP